MLNAYNGLVDRVVARYKETSKRRRTTLGTHHSGEPRWTLEGRVAAYVVYTVSVCGEGREVQCELD